MTEFAEPHERRCRVCSQLYRTDEPGARWRSKKWQPRYLHPGCEQPGRGWTLADNSKETANEAAEAL